MALTNSIVNTIVFSIISPLDEGLHVSVPQIDDDTIGELHNAKELFDIQELHS